MSLFDSITGDIAQKFGLGDRANSLVNSLISHISAQGIGGFLSKFQQAGLGDAVNSWISTGENSALSAEQLTGALGEHTLQDIAGKAGISANEAKPALAMLIPSMVNSLTPNGVVPTSLPESVMGYLKGGATAAIGAAGNALDRGTSAVGGGVDAVRNVAGETRDMVKGAPGGSLLVKLLTLLALGLLGFWGYKYFNNASNPTAPMTQASEPVATVKEMPTKDGALAVAAEKDGKYIVVGTVPDPKTKDDIVAMLTEKYGEGHFNADSLNTDPAVKAPDWLGKLGGALDALKGNAGAVLNFNGPDIKLEGMTAKAATGLLEKLKDLFGAGFNVSLVGPINEAQAAETAEQQATSALDKLGDTFTAEQLAAALNLQIINFSSGSAAIPKDRADMLMKSAAYIKKLPAGSKLEVGGHTDSTGNAAMNQGISQQRANAVKSFLEKAGVGAGILTAKGYGPDKPIASNDTPEGQFKNRRIEFIAGK
jgi:outer membrane protein OmpA-like peptidoglycan-associated protein/uncharacterized protein YidB (DUF937 family)